MKSLCIVHLCSLDSVAWQCLRSDWHCLRDSLVEAVQTWPANLPIVVLDQQWGEPTSSCHAHVREALEDRTNTIWFPHDENIDDWEEAMLRLASSLAAHDITHLTLAGAWLGSGDPIHPDTSGCVNTVYRHLASRGFEVEIDKGLCAQESWLYE